MKRKIAGSALVALAQAGALPLAAQDSVPFDLGVIRIETDQAQAVLGNDKVTEEEIEARNPATTADVFAGESAVTASGGAPIGQKVFVNGIEESLLNVTIDGARQNKSAFHHTGNVLLDPELLKSVEISAGLAPADAGPGGLGGSIAYTTKDARDLLEDGDYFGGRFSITAGSNGADLRSSLTLFGQSGGFEYLLSGTKASGSDYADGDGTRILGTEPSLTDFVAKLAYTTQSGKRLSFAASRTKDDGLRAAQAGPGGLFFIRPDFAGVTTGPSVLVEGLSQRTSYTFTYTDEEPDGWLAPTVQLSYNEQEIDAVGIYGVNDSFSGVIKNEFQLGNGTLTAGVDFFDESAEGIGRGPGPFASSGTEKLRNIGVFAQVRPDLGARVSVSYGARYDWQDFDAADGTKFSDSGASVNGSIDVKLTDALTLNAGAASTWGGFELGEAALINFGTAWDYTGLKPSRAKSARIGFRFEQGPWTAKLAYFDTEVDDIASVLPTGGLRGVTADLTTRGFDGSIGYQAERGFVRVNFTRADVKINGAAAGSTAYYLGRPLGDVIGLEAGFDLSDEWRIGGNGQIALKNNDAALPLDSYEVVNLYAEYRPRRVENLRLRLDVHNLFDETFSKRSSDGIDSTRVIPLTEPGRTVSLTATLLF